MSFTPSFADYDFEEESIGSYMARKLYEEEIYREMEEACSFSDDEDEEDYLPDNDEENDIIGPVECIDDIESDINFSIDLDCDDEREEELVDLLDCDEKSEEDLDFYDD